MHQSPSLSGLQSLSSGCNYDDVAYDVYTQLPARDGIKPCPVTGRY
jgi:hypothetical protein